MRFALLLVLAIGCGSRAKNEDTTTTATDGTQTSSSAGAADPAAAGTTSSAPPATAGGSAPSGNNPPPSGGKSTPTGSKPAASGGKPYYSCFQYVAKNTTQKRHACMRSDDCGPYLEQAKSVAGIRELTGCASVQTVYCFHQVGTKEDPEGLDVCQPTLEECKKARADVVKAKMSVDTDCAQRS